MLTYPHFEYHIFSHVLYPGPQNPKPGSPSVWVTGVLGRYEPFWAPMLKWRWALGARNKCAEKGKADDRWRTAYDSFSLNRPNEIKIKHFIGQTSAGRWLRRRCRNYWLLRVLGTSTELKGPGSPHPREKYPSFSC